MKLGPSHHQKTIHLNDAELHPALPECPWCGSTNRRAIATLQRSPDVFLLKCSACHACSASRMPTPEVLDAYYGNYYGTAPDGHTANEGLVTFGDAPRMGAHLARALGPTGDRETLSILDFGGGDGALAASAAEAVLKSNKLLRKAGVTVVDYNTVMHAPADPNIEVRGARSLAELGNESYDFVIASGILEHIPAGAGILDDLLARVKIGGSFYSRTPVAAPFLCLAQALGGSWDFTFPGHVHDMGQAFWESYFARNGRDRTFIVRSSRPSIVAASMRKRPVEAMMSHLMKLPWQVLGRAWGLVGGWEITVSRR